MIAQIPFVLKIPIDYHRRLIALKPWNGKWGDNSISDIKAEIKRQLETVQNYCAYCGLPFKGSKDKQIEHIAPKANFRNPEFTFTLHNLVLSCGYCNDLIVKGTKPTIELPPHRSYKNCIFTIVHPYFDDPNDHYEWTDEDDQILIQIKNNSLKAKYSIEIFDLASEEMSGFRAGVKLQQERKRLKQLSTLDESLIRESLNYKE